MKRSTSIMLCALAVCVAGAFAASSAWAGEPEYKGCGKAAKSGKSYTGAYANKTCSEVEPKHEGHYELVAPKLPSKVKSTIGKVDIYLYDPMTETVEGHFECASGKGAGEITSGRDGTVSISFKGCQATKTLAGPCNSPGQKSGVVTSEPLSSKLVWLNEAETEVGIAYTAAKAGGAITKVVCAGGAETAEMVGTMVARIAPTGEAAKSETIAFNASATNGEPEFSGQWESGAFVSEPLFSNLKGLKEHEDVPTGVNATLTQKGKAIVVTG